MSLATREVSWDVGGRRVVDGVTLDVTPGTVVGLLGPNGSGKSSLLRLLAGTRTPTSGQVLLDGDDLRRVRRRDVARRIAVVEQHAQTELDLVVSDVVRLGRIPHRGTWSAESDADRSAVSEALERVELTALAGRSWHTLSGGERQRVHIARALAQQPQELLLDEPTNHLDVHHQLDLLGLVRRLRMTSVVALHDLNLAAMFCDRLVVLKDGAVVATGTPTDVLTPELIAEVYRVRAVVADLGPGGVPSVRFEPGPP
ncbi:ABC transporter ATP-binding protein [Aeromicrobium fastidiosum]|uniref:ABC transporter ATP-binding protein n=1 Tax=Aeromicrobium fastidiosum TaxID=52699 RepID=A0A641AU28_9ACTN|nr:ABC transporter ATP-binding protein [Aeromicrobium fastidiosum]KAA1380531.1 ABC transporter ATP-binding protein [Aeromicrobium fastidiosum]MBP2390124.1 iron complex transport system ATP-binding protein [Aeromicrobium fastidiosum]